MALGSCVLVSLESSDTATFCRDQQVGEPLSSDHLQNRCRAHCIIFDQASVFIFGAPIRRKWQRNDGREERPELQLETFCQCLTSGSGTHAKQDQGRSFCQGHLDRLVGYCNNFTKCTVNLAIVWMMNP